jgi:hypothetical protein
VRIEFLREPELDFGSGRHVDIRFGIMNYGPHDIGDAGAPSQIRVGVVGTPEVVEVADSFLERSRAEIAPAKSRQPNLRPPFPGFRPDTAFHSTLIRSGRLTRTVHPRALDDLRRQDDANALVREAVDLILDEFEYLQRNERPDVLICAVPPQLQTLMDPATRPAVPTGEARLDFHDLLKARAMHLPPVQLMLPSTSDPSRARKAKRTGLTRQIQDEATRAWNLHTALYYKARGRPWRLPRDPSAFTTCFVGISFYHALDSSSVLTSMAQVFDERGDGVIVQGGRAELSKVDRTPHLNERDSHDILQLALRQYRQTHGTLPARVVVHKTSSFVPAEIGGLRAAADELRIDRIDMVSVSDSKSVSQRLFRYGAYPPLRGTMVTLDEQVHLLYTRGSVEFYATYPGLYVPQPLLFRCDDVQEGPRQLAREMLGLSKLNWNQTQFDGSVPITIIAARKVSKVLRYADAFGPGRPIAARYSHYM